MVNLPRGGQIEIIDYVGNVTEFFLTVPDILPRISSYWRLVPIKFKRKLKYKGQSMYQATRPENVLKAL